MSIFQLALLAIVQGLTEWLPISSSAHLILLPRLTPLPDQGPLIDAMAHLGSLGALALYFRADMAALVRGGFDLALGKQGPDGVRRRWTEDSKLFTLLAIATPPGLVVGAVYALTDLSELVRNVYVIAGATIGFGVVLWAADHFGRRTRTNADFGVRDALFIGLSQAVAFIPGTSRSGITMTVARALGFERDAAARIGMLVGLPLLLASGAFAVISLIKDGAFALADDGTLIPVTFTDGAIVMGLTFVAAYASIAIFMALAKRIGFLPFVLYRFALGAFLLWVGAGHAG